MPWVKTVDAQPFVKKLPHSNLEATMDEEVIVVLFGLLAKQTKPTIVPTTFSQSIHRPKPILKS
jgi:hypothetical protein